MRPPIASAGCFGEKGPTPNPGRGLRFPARWLPNRNSPHPHQKAAAQNRGLTAYNRTAGPVHLGTSPAIVIGEFRSCGSAQGSALDPQAFEKA